MSKSFEKNNSSRYLGVLAEQDGDRSARSLRSQSSGRRIGSRSKRWSVIRNSILGQPASGIFSEQRESIRVESNETQELHRQLQIETASIRKQLGEQVRKGQTLLGLITKMHQEPTGNPSAFLTKMAVSLQEESNDITNSVYDKADDLRMSAYDEGQRNLVESALARTPWTSCFRGGHVVVGLLSDIYEGIRTIEAGSTKDDQAEVWEAPQTFVRETHKYWVDEKRLGEVMMVCAEELPLLVYGQNSGSLYNADEYINPDQDIFERFASKITSIYFDSPDLYLYQERLARSEGANLVRVRWYNEQPKGDQVLFLELKTHHESWVHDKSAKERVEILERDMHLLLERDNDAWDVEYAESIAIAAKKDLGDKELLKAAGLLLRIRNIIIQRDLRPCVRTSYTRIAFQSSKSNALRLTMDRDIRVSDETAAPLGAWFAPDHYDKANALVPCPVFEVKLAGKGMPSSVESLILKGAIKNGHKFSKFITGVSVLNAESPHLKTFPYWAAEPIFVKLYAGNDTASADSGRFIGDDPDSDGDADVEKGRSIPTSAPVRTPGGRIIEFKKPVAPKTRARIEPKSYFAAERTYIQWVSAALLLITVASILDALSVSSTRATEITMMVLAAMISIYALAVYFRRLYLLENAKPYGYQDHLGPVVLTAAVFFGIITILVFSVRADKAGTANTNSIMVESGSCVPHNFTGISMLAFQPSDVIVDAERDIFIIPSTTDIKALPRNLMIGTPEELQSLAFVDRADLEAVTFGENGILYAVAERPISSELLAFQWPDTNTKPELIGRWVLNEAANVEGMTYVPSESLGPGEGSRLLISADATDPLQSNVLIFELPTEFTMDGTILFSINALNAGLLTGGLDSSSSTRISAMTEFEGDLYILHDNVRTIRGWNLATGNMIAEWTTPRAGRGSNRQWEGLFLERVGTDVVLHMALDTPAQLWSFFLEEEGTSLILPPCAQAF